MKIKSNKKLAKAFSLIVAMLVLEWGGFVLGSASPARAPVYIGVENSTQEPTSSATSATAQNDDDDAIASILAAYQQSVSPGHVSVDVANLSVIYNASQDTGSTCTPFLDTPAYALSSGFVSSTNDFVLQFVTESVSGSNYWVRGRMSGTGVVTQPFKVDCSLSILDSPRDPVSADYAGGQWANGLFQESGTIYTLIHNEYYGGNYPVGLDFSIQATDQCNLGQPNGTMINPFNCTYGAIGIASISSASGGAFVPENGRPGYLVARSSFNFPPNGGGQNAQGVWGAFTGYPTNTNIVKQSDGYYYFMAGETFPNGSPSSYGGMAAKQIYCPIRTNNLSDPTSWRAWDGVGYSVNTHAGNDCTGIANAPLFPFYLGYNTYFRRYILVGATSPSPQNLSNPAFKNGEVAYALSNDLVHWTQHVWLGVPMWDPDNGGWSQNNYVSLIDPKVLETVGDPNSSSGAITGKDPYLLLVQHNSSLGNGATRLVEIPIHFSN